jgi:F-type H+-transporting ATPase subunit b
MASRNACEFRRKVRVMMLLAALALVPVTASGAGVQPDTEHAAKTPEPRAADEHAAEEHGLWSGLLWPTVNFAILCGVLYYFLKDPISAYLRDRHQTIRKDLVEAAELRAEAARQIADVDERVQALPGQIAALRTRGAEEIAAEEQRIGAVAAAERERLLEQTRREIAFEVRRAKRELVEHAAELSVRLATDRIERDITPADQARLVDQYLDQMEKGQ